MQRICMKFKDLGLSSTILETISAQGYDIPSPIQAQAIPAVLDGRDVMAAAQTGTGKTAGFTLPLLDRLSKGRRASRNQVRALILTPTRELAAQVQQSVEAYGENLPLSSAVVFGGVKINPQMMRMRRGVDILVATPGRLLDLYKQNAVKFDYLEVLVLDEADRMLDMGFIHDLKRILAALPKNRQNLMFSATFSDDIRRLAKGLIHDPVEISVSPRNKTADTVEQCIYPVDKSSKSQLLIELIHKNDWQQVLVFSRTKHGANKLAKQLEGEGISAAAIHGNKSQGARTRALEGFKQGSVRVLVATDIAARGIDIDQLPQVVNFDLPNVPEDYVHRIGRTGRAGAEGRAVSLVSADEFEYLFYIERLIKQVLPRKEVRGFEPREVLPPSDLNGRPPKKSKGPASQRSRPSARPSRGGHKSGSRTPKRTDRTSSSSDSGERSGPPAKKRTNSNPSRRRRSFRPRRNSGSNRTTTGNDFSGKS